MRSALLVFGQEVWAISSARWYLKILVLVFIVCVDYGFLTWVQRVTAVTAGSLTDFALFFMLTERDRDSGRERGCR